MFSVLVDSVLGSRLGSRLGSWFWVWTWPRSVMSCTSGVTLVRLVGGIVRFGGSVDRSLVVVEKKVEARKYAKKSTGQKIHFLSNYLPIIVLGTMVVSIHWGTMVI